MSRTNSAAVREILGSNYDSEGVPSLQPFIDTASDMVDRVVTCAASKGITHSASTLELIERWLAAHCYHVMDPTYQSRSTAGASGQFMGTSAMALDGSRYGQTAKMLDTSGCLGSRTATGVWVGKKPTDQISYVDRR